MVPIFLLSALLAAVYIYPVFQGLVLLPLDLLVSNSPPWVLASQILIKNSYMLDSVIQIFPWRHLTFTSLTHGIIPLWNPYQLTGLPFMAGMKTMVFYPLNLLFIFGEIPAWNLLLFFQLFLSFCFMYLLVRSFRISLWGSLLSATAFAYSSLMVGFLQFGSDGHSLIWLPYLLYCVHSYSKDRKTVYLIGLGLGICFAIFAGHLQMVAYECVLLIAFVGYLMFVKKIPWGKCFIIFLTILFGIGMAAIQLIPDIELFQQSFRGLSDTRDQFAGGLLRFYELFRIFSPDLFGHPASKDLHIGYIETSGYYGLIPLFFTFFAFQLWKTNPFVRFFTIVCISAVILSIWPFGIVLSVLRLPIITSASGGRLFFLALFSGALLSGFGFDLLLQQYPKKKYLKWVTFFVFAVLGVFFFAFLINKYVVSFGATMTNLKFCTAIAILFFTVSFFYTFLEKKGKIVTWGFILLILSVGYFDVFRMGYRFLTFSNSKFMYPDIPIIQLVREKSKNSLSRMYGLVASEVPSYVGVYSIETYNSLYPVRTAKLLKALDGQELIMVPRNSFTFDHGGRLKYVFDVLGVSYIVIQEDQNPSLVYFRSPVFEKDLIKIYEDEHNDVYMNKTAYKRFDLFYQVQSGLSEKIILDDIKNGKTDLRQTLLLEEPLNQELSMGSGSAQLVASNVNSQLFSVQTDKPALFYISDAYFPGWKAMVNGKESHIYRANYNFRAVLVPAGESKLEFRYEPASYRMGIYVSLGSLLSLCMLGILNASFVQKLPKEKNKKRTKAK